MSLRKELVMFAGQEGANKRALFRRYGIEPWIGYKWLKRHAAEGDAGLADRSRRPHNSPRRTSAAVEAKIVALRRKHPCWGGRKLRRRLVELGEADIPHPSTITEILRRHGLIDEDASVQHRAFQRFERQSPNELWQMDFKGHFETNAGRCHPLTVLDDHSRFALAIRACADEGRQTVQGALTGVFRRYGLPERMLTDNGPPWAEPEGGWTVFAAWLLRLGVGLTHGRPYHPQTQGKDERFHRTLKAEVISTCAWRDIAQCGRAFEAWRDVYNSERPHEALDLATPASRYRPSPREFPEQLPPIEYDLSDKIRKVQDAGRIAFAGRQWRIGKGFAHQRVAIRPTIHDGRYAVYFCHHKVAEIDLHEPNP